MQRNIIANIIIFCISTMVLIWIEQWLLLAISAMATSMVSIPFLHNKTVTFWHKIPKRLASVLYWTSISTAAICLVLFLKIYVVDVLRLPTNSMEPDFNAGQLIVVNKLTMGPRINTNSLTHYRRAKGLNSINKGDIVVFNVPFQTIDSTLQLSFPQQTLMRLSNNNVMFKPRYIKRLTALPGDTLEIANGQTWVNGQTSKMPIHWVKNFKLKHNRIDSLPQTLKNKVRASFIYQKDTVVEMESQHIDSLTLQYIEPFYLGKNMPDPNIFPYVFLWNSDNLGPIVIPQKGASVDLTIKNLPLYKKIITQYEHNTLDVKKAVIYINGEPAKSYTFKMNYYWVMGDNMPHSFDSRYWGFLPENHIIGISKTHFNLGF